MTITERKKHIPLPEIKLKPFWSTYIDIYRIIKYLDDPTVVETIEDRETSILYTYYKSGNPKSYVFNDEENRLFVIINWHENGKMSYLSVKNVEDETKYIPKEKRGFNLIYKISFDTDEKIKTLARGQIKSDVVDIIYENDNNITITNCKNTIIVNKNEITSYEYEHDWYGTYKTIDTTMLKKSDIIKNCKTEFQKGYEFAKEYKKIYNKCQKIMNRYKKLSDKYEELYLNYVIPDKIKYSEEKQKWIENTTER